MKRILSFALALCMLLTCTAFAETEAATYTWNSAWAEFPTVWSPFQTQTDTDSDLGDLLMDGFYAFDFNEDYDG